MAKIALELDGMPSCSAGVLPGARPVAAVTASRMALNHSATNWLNRQGEPDQTFAGREKEAFGLAAFVVGHADEIKARRIHHPRIMADAEVADGSQRDDGGRPGASEGELAVVEEHLALAAIKEELTVERGELFRRGDVAGAGISHARRGAGSLIRLTPAADRECETTVSTCVRNSAAVW